MPPENAKESFEIDPIWRLVALIIFLTATSITTIMNGNKKTYNKQEEPPAVTATTSAPEHSITEEIKAGVSRIDETLRKYIKRNLATEGDEIEVKGKITDEIKRIFHSRNPH